MKYTFQFNSLEEREQLIIEHSGKYLVEEQNITEGNFLVFSDTMLEPPKVYVNVPQLEFENSKEKLIQQEEKIIEIKKTQSVTSAVVSEISTTLQDLIEMTTEMGNV